MNAGRKPKVLFVYIQPDHDAAARAWAAKLADRLAPAIS